MNRGWIMCLCLAVSACGADAEPEPVSVGDDFVVVGRGEAPEIVDLESDGRFSILCGGFGGRVFDIRDPRMPIALGPIGGRCQRIAIGPLLANDSRVVYIAHHGDTRWWPPYLRTYGISDAGDITLLDQQPDKDIFYEGMAWANGALYVAAHAGGVRVYSTDATGVPNHVTTLDGFDNAWKIAIGGDHAYVADRYGVHVLDITTPLAPTRVSVVQTPGQALDVHIHGQRLYVALGSSGAEVFDVSDPASPAKITRIGTRGSTQAVAADDSRIALANWSHVELIDANTFETLATDSVRGPLEQDTGVALEPGFVLLAEWGTGLHVLEHRPGLVAPDIWVDDGFFSFRGDSIEARAVVVRNRGETTLHVHRIEVTDPGIFSVDAECLSIPAGGAASFELTYVPAAAIGFDSFLTLHTDDPDRPELALPLRVGEERDVKVGDILDERFDFLDPTGANQVENLDDKVVLLAYFGVW